MPWNTPPLNEWSIVGMNHYFVKGRRYLFVAMARDGRLIQAEGTDEQLVFASLRIQATQGAVAESGKAAVC